MVYDVDIVEAAGMKCDDMVKATAARCFRRNFELMFIDSWGFHYESNEDGICFGKTIGFGKCNFAQNLKRYHGVETVKIAGVRNRDCLKFAVSQLEEGRPVDLKYDQAYLPWAKEIRKKAPLRYTGNIMMTGNAQEKFYCIDIHGTHKREELPFASFQEYADSVNNMDFLVFYKQQNMEKPDLKEHIETTLNRIYGMNNDMFGQMTLLANDIKERFDFEREIAYTEKYMGVIPTPNWIYFVDDIINIGRMRALYSVSLKYLSDIYGNGSLLKLSDDFKMIWSRWQLLTAVLVKSYFSGDFHKLNEILAKHLRQIIELEKVLTKKLENCAEDNNSIRESHIKSTMIQKNKAERFQHLDISEFCNNKAFSKMIKEEEQADFDGLHNYYLLTALPEDHLFTGDNPEFGLITEGMDNIKCCGQYLRTDMTDVNSIRILGACESGAFYGNFIVYYEGGEIQESILGFGEWRFQKCELGEKPALTCGRFYCGEVKEEEKGYLFSNMLEILNKDRIVGIRLPHCENMHIFAITFAVGISG